MLHQNRERLLWKLRYGKVCNRPGHESHPKNWQLFDWSSLLISRMKLNIQKLILKFNFQCTQDLIDMFCCNINQDLFVIWSLVFRSIWRTKWATLVTPISSLIKHVLTSRYNMITVKILLPNRSLEKIAMLMTEVLTENYVFMPFGKTINFSLLIKNLHLSFSKGDSGDCCRAVVLKLVFY